jgi:hypothetical protein
MIWNKDACAKTVGQNGSQNPNLAPFFGAGREFCALNAEVGF